MSSIFFRSSVRLAGLAGIALAAAALGACSSGSSEATQVVARVNDAEITISQLRAALAAKGAQQTSPEAARQALEGLVNEQLLVDAALRDKLDRDPVVVQALEDARRQLLARAYVERSVFPKQEISAADQAAYYKSNPELFSQRRVYQLTAYTFPSTLLQENVVQALDSATTPAAVAAALEAHHIVAETQTLSRSAEQLPLDQLPRFVAADVGDVVMQTARDGRATLMLITSIQNSPIGFESAQPIIQQYLSNVRNAEALDGYLKQARAASSIAHTDATLFAAVDELPVVPEPDAREHRMQNGAAVLN